MKYEAFLTNSIISLMINLSFKTAAVHIDDSSGPSVGLL
jgi:hypothetical protein